MLLPLAPALPGAPGRWGWRGQVGVSGAGVAVTVNAAVVVVVGVRDTVAAMTANQERPLVVTVVQHEGGDQQQHNERAEQEEKHVDAFRLSRVGRAATCGRTGSQQPSTSKLCSLL